MTSILVAIWRLARAYLFYPLMVGLFIWIYVTDKHWIFGLAIIAAILILDLMWRIIGGNIIHLTRKGPKG